LAVSFAFQMFLLQMFLFQGKVQQSLCLLKSSSALSANSLAVSLAEPNKFF
jgi:hypothetical protein